MINITNATGAISCVMHRVNKKLGNKCTKNKKFSTKIGTTVYQKGTRLADHNKLTKIVVFLLCNPEVSLHFVTGILVNLFSLNMPFLQLQLF